MKEAQTVTDFADASHSKSAKSTATTVLYGIFRSENSYPCAVTKHVQYTLLLYIRKATVYNNYRSFAVPILRGYAVTLIGFVSIADQNHAPGLSDVRLELQGSTLYTFFSLLPYA